MSGAGALENGALEDAALEDAALEDRAPEDAALEDAALEDAALENGALEDAALEDRAPEDAPPEAVEQRLELEWELWVIENLVTGAAVSNLVEALSAQGVARDAASARIEEIAKSPRLASLRRRTTRGLMAEQELRLRRAVRGRRELPRHAELSASQFHEAHWRPSLPVVLTDAMRRVPAVQRWSQAWLRERYGELEVEVNIGRLASARRSHRERESETVTLASFLDHAAREEGDERYIVSKNGLLARDELRELEADLRPLPDMLVAPELPVGVSLWVGPAGTFSPAHFDPHGVLLTQVEGRKRVRLVAPDQLAMLERMDGFFARRSLDDPELHASPDFDREEILDVTLEPGECLFIPAGWFHEVRALDASMTLSFLCFRWPNHFHWLRSLTHE